MSKAARLLISFIAFLVLLLAFPFYKIVFLIATLLHIPVFIWGIIDIQNCFFCKARCHKKGEQQMLALTFDDGPDPRITPEILDLLQKYQFQATFFMIGRNVEKYPDLARSVIEKGHVIACHDLDHRLSSNFRFTRSMINDISRAQTILEKVTGKKPHLYRPPVGLTNPHLPKALKTCNMECIGWSGSVRDGGNRFKKTFAFIPELARPGSVVLLHDSMPLEENKELFLQQLENLFETIKKKGLTPTGVDTLFGINAYI